MDKYNKFQPLCWLFNKTKRVTRSVLGSEVMAIDDAFDMTYNVKYDLQAISKQVIHISILTNSLSLFYVLSKATASTEKRLMIDLQSVKDSYRNKEITMLHLLCQNIT